MSYLFSAKLYQIFLTTSIFSMKKKWENKENQDVSGNLYSIFILTEAKGQKLFFESAEPTQSQERRTKLEVSHSPISNHSKEL